MRAAPNPLPAGTTSSGSGAVTRFALGVCGIRDARTWRSACTCSMDTPGFRRPSRRSQYTSGLLSNGLWKLVSGRMMADIEAQLDGSGNFVDVLAARAGSANKGHCEFGIWNEYGQMLFPE